MVQDSRGVTAGGEHASWRGDARRSLRVGPGGNEQKCPARLPFPTLLKCRGGREGTNKNSPPASPYATHPITWHPSLNYNVQEATKMPRPPPLTQRLHSLPLRDASALRLLTKHANAKNARKPHKTSIYRRHLYENTKANFPKQISNLFYPGARCGRVAVR